MNAISELLGVRRESHAKKRNSFPYYDNGLKDSPNLLSSYFKFYISSGETIHGPYGYLPEWVVEKMPWNNHWAIDNENRKVTLASAKGHSSHNEIIQDTLLQARELRRFKVLETWRNEPGPIHGSRSKTTNTISVERVASSLFGINACGVHMTVYTRAEDSMKIWVPRRARSKRTYAGMLDNTVAGALVTGEWPLQCLVREAAEEASFSEQLIMTHAKACGTVSYIHVQDERTGQETGLLRPECLYVYEMEVGPDVKPEPNDTEVEEFYLWTIDAVKEHMIMGEFKPNCALVLLDFFVRHGILTAEEEPEYAEIVSRLHRTLPFPTTL